MSIEKIIFLSILLYILSVACYALVVYVMNQYLPNIFECKSFEKFVKISIYTPGINSVIAVIGLSIFGVICVGACIYLVFQGVHKEIFGMFK